MRHLAARSPSLNRGAFGRCDPTARPGTQARPVITGDGNQAASGFVRDGRILFTDNLRQPEWYLFAPGSGALERVNFLTGIEAPLAGRAAVG